MGGYMQTSGTVVVERTPEARRAVEALQALLTGRAESADVISTELEDGTVKVDVHYYGMMSYGTGEELDEAIGTTLEPVVVEAARFDTECDGEDGFFWVGKEASIKLNDSALALEEIKVAAHRLNAEGRRAAIAFITSLQ